jgi:hypothetical protein
VNGTGYRLLGFAVWRAGKWYARRRAHEIRTAALKGLAVAAGLGATVAIGRRLAG